MYFALMGKLSARRQNLTADKDKGFTLIELLVVVIIIGILAAIAIPVYLGVQNNAKDSAVQSDITNLKTAVISLQTNSGTLPTKFGPLNGTADAATFPAVGTATTAWADAGATIGKNTKALSYGPSATDSFCIIGQSTSDKLFYATGSKGVSTTPCTIS
ncbi:type II secretion system protein [Frigoribacterium salinisoli]